MLACGYRGGGANPVSRDLLWFGLYTGMRRGEIMALRWEAGGPRGGAVPGGGDEDRGAA